MVSSCHDSQSWCVPSSCQRLDDSLIPCVFAPSLTGLPLRIPRACVTHAVWMCEEPVIAGACICPFPFRARVRKGYHYALATGSLPQSLHADRVVGGDRDYCDPHRPVAPRRPEGPRSRRPDLL